MTTLKHVAASVTLATIMLPGIGRADDDVAALRAELDAKYGTGYPEWVPKGCRPEQD